MESSMQSAVLLFAVLALTVHGQLMIKLRVLVHAPEIGGPAGRLLYLASMFSDFWVLSALAAAVLAGACWMLAVSRLEIGYTYPCMALSFVLVPIDSTVLFGEPLPGIRLVGIALIVAGVTVSALAR
jgi:multidrug transporter EmrE-like cation transporter